MKSQDKIIQKQIDDCLALLQTTLGKHLLGVYIYGSFLLGGLQKFSDIDLFVVSNRKTTSAEKELLEKALLKISGVYAVSVDRKPIELTIVVQKEIQPWRYPPTFDFLYGDWLRKDFESGTIEPWSTKILPNLALVITQLQLSHKTLIGPEPNELLDQIPYRDFFEATTAEVDNLTKDILWDTRNVLLTLARIWSTLETDTIRSKKDAASWAIGKLPNNFKPVLGQAKAILLGEKEEGWENMKAQVDPCAYFMVEKIRELMKLIQQNNFMTRNIRLE